MNESIFLFQTKNDQCVTSAFSTFRGVFKEIRQIEARKTKASFHLSEKTNVNIEERAHNPEK